MWRRKAAEDTYSAQSASLQRLALYDEEYAKQNGLTTQKLNDNAWMVKDSMSGLTTTFFDNGFKNILIKFEFKHIMLACEVLLDKIKRINGNCIDDNKAHCPI